MDACWTTYLTLCRPYELAEPWSGRRADDCALRGPADPAAAAAYLQDRHSAPKLIRGGLVRRDAAGGLTLHPLLAPPDVGLILLRDPATGKPVNLLTEEGCVCGDQAPAFAVLRDRHTRDALKGPQRELFLTGSLADAVLLRSFGLAAAPHIGFGRLKQSDVELLSTHFGVKQGPSEREREERFAARQAERDAERAAHAATRKAQPGGPKSPPEVAEDETDSDDLIRLTFVRWTPHLLSPQDPVGMAKVIEDLQLMKRHRRLEIEEICQWFPEPRDLEAIRFALARGESNWVHGAFLDCANAGIGSIEYFKPKAAVIAPPTDLAGAVEQLQAAMLVAHDEPSRQRRREALSHYHRVVAQQITGPLLREAAHATDPLERALRLQFIQLSALFLEQAPQVREPFLHGLRRHGDKTNPRGDKSVAELLAIGGQMISLAKELTKWKSPSNSAPRRGTARPLNPSQRFTASDFSAQN